MRNGTFPAAALVLGLLAWLATAGGASPAAAEPVSCLKIRSLTAFAPRGEVYVEVEAKCAPEDFENGEAIVAYLELMIGDLPAVGHDLRFEPSEPRRRQTVVFDGRDLLEGDAVLVRLVRSGEVLGLRTLTVR